MIEILKTIATKTDPIVLLAIISGFGYLLHKLILIKKDVDYINKAVNDRGEDELTMSQEIKVIGIQVGKLTTKTEVQVKEIAYVKEQIDLHREVDEKTFEQLAEDIAILRDKV
jgi:hypothetical protein